MSWRSRSETASCRRKELEAFINFVANFHSALQFTFIVSEIELPFLDITLRISGTRIQISVHYNDTTLTTSSIFLLSILRTANVLSLTASFSACVAFALAMLTSLCDQRRWFLSLLTVVILFPHLKMIYREYQPLAVMTRCARPNRVITVDRVPLVLTYHPFNTKIKRFLLQNFRILSMDEQTRCVFPHGLQARRQFT